MAKLPTCVQPQRRGARGAWIACEPNRAQRFAVLIKGKAVTSAKSKHLAQAILDIYLKQRASARVGLKLGRRISEKRGAGLLDNLLNGDTNVRSI